MEITITINGITLTATGDPDEMAAYTRNITFDTATIEEFHERPTMYRAVRRYGYSPDVTIHHADCDHQIGTQNRTGVQEAVTPEEYADWLRTTSAETPHPIISVTFADCAR